MNLFRSEGHVRSWSQFDPAAEEAVMPLADYVTLWGAAHYRARLEKDYVSRFPKLWPDRFAVLERLGRMTPFWRPG